MWPLTCAPVGCRRSGGEWSNIGKSRAYVNMETAKVLAEFLLLLGSDILEVLVTEDHNTTLGYQQGELILLDVCQLRQLKTSDFSADTGCQFGCLQVRIFLGQKVWLCWICVETTVLEVKQFGGRELGGGVIDGEVRRIFGLLCTLE